MHERGRPHPDCPYCDGSGLRENTLGNSTTCFCTWDEKWISELETAAAKRRLAKLLEKEQLTDWDL